MEPPYAPKIPLEVSKVKIGSVNFHTVLASPPAETPYKGSILFIHGFAEFAELYARLQGELAENGYECFFFDQRGSGHTSPGAYKGLSNEHYTFKDLDAMIERQLKRIESRDNKTFFLMGHSMGGGIALNYLIHGKFRNKVTGVAITGPLIDLEPTTKPNFVLRKIMPLAARVVPNITIDTKLNIDHITSDPEYQQFLIDNGKISKAIGTIGLLYDAIARGLKLMDPEYVKDLVKVPVLIIHGVNDKINDIEGSRKYAEILPCQVNLVEHPESMHSVFLENKKIRKETMKDVLEWLDANREK